MSLRKLYVCFLVLIISVFSSFSLFANELSKSEWDKAFDDIKCSTVKYSVNGYLNKLNIGNVSGSLKLAKEKMFLNTNLSVSSSLDLIFENLFGSTVSGEYNVYAVWHNADEFVLDELKYTTKNSKSYTSIKDNYLLKDIVNTYNNSFNAEGEDSYRSLIKAISDKDNYEYKNGKYTGSFEFEKKSSANSNDDTSDSDEDVEIKFAITFNNKKQVSVIELEMVDSAFTNPATNTLSTLKMVLKGYVYNINKTVIVSDEIN